jgi:hypothetical protein
LDSLGLADGKAQNTRKINKKTFLLSGTRVFTRWLGILRGNKFFLHLMIARRDGTKNNWSVVVAKGQIAGVRNLPPKAPGRSLNSSRTNTANPRRTCPGGVIKLQGIVVDCSNEDKQGDLH